MSITGTAGNETSLVINARIKAEQVKVLFEHANTALLGNVVCSIGLVALLWREEDQNHLLMWLVALNFLTALRFGIGLNLRNHMDEISANADTYGFWFTFASGISGCLWGLLPAVFFDPQNAYALMFITITIVGMCAGALGSLASYRPAYLAYLLPATIPFVIRGAIVGNTEFYIFSALFVFFIAMMLRFGTASENLMIHNIRARLTQSDAIDEITREREAAEQAKAALQESEHRLSSILETCPGAISILNKDGHRIYTNPKYDEMFAVSEPGGALGRHFSETWADRQDMARGLEQVERTGNLRGFEALQRRFDGSTFWCMIDRMPFIFDGEEATICWLYDISDRKSAEQDAKDNSELINVMLDSIEQGVAVRDADGQVVIYNDQLCELTGIPKDRYETGMSIKESREIDGSFKYIEENDPELFDNLQDWDRRQRAGEPVDPMSYEALLANGRWIMVTQNPMAGGMVVRTFLDTTKRKLAEQEALEQNRFLEATLENMGQGLLVMDEDGRFVLFNDRACDLLNVPASYLESQPTNAELWKYMDSIGEFRNVEENRREEIRNAISNQVPKDELFYERQRGDGRWIQIHCKERNEGGAVITYQDVTHQKLVENDAKEKAEFLSLTMENMDQGLLVLDEDERVVLYNNRACELIGASSEFLKNAPTNRELFKHQKSLGEFANVDEMEIAALTEWVFTDEKGSAFVYDRQRPDGTWLHVSTFKRSDGGWVRTFLDITDLKAAEAETSEKNRFLELTLDNMDQGLIVLSPEDRIVLYNKNVCDLINVAPEFMETNPTSQEIFDYQDERGEFDNISKEERAAIRSRVDSGAYTGSFSYDRQRADGTWLHISTMERPDGGWVRTFMDVTEEKRSEQEAIARADDIELILQNMDQGIIVRDREDNILHFNDRLCELLNIDRSVYAGNASSRELFEIHSERGDFADMPDKIKDAIVEYTRRKDAGELVEPISYERQRSDGDWLWVTMHPLPDGREVRTFLDITDQKEAEFAAREQSRILTLTLDNMGQGLTMYDNEWNLLAYNDRYREHFDLPADLFQPDSTFDEILGETMRRDYGEDQVVPRLKVVKDPNRMYNIWRREFPRPTGRWLDVFSVPIPNGGGFVVTTTDITERKHAENETVSAKEKAEHAEERLRAALNAMPAGVIVHDEEMGFDLWNQRYLELTGYNDEQIREFGNLEGVARHATSEGGGYPEESFEEHFARRIEMYESRQPRSFSEYWAGVERHMDISINPIPSGGWISIYLDMTETYESAKELQLAKESAEAARAEAEQTEEQIRGILQHLPVGVLVFDGAKKIRYWNKQLCEVTGTEHSFYETAEDIDDIAAYMKGRFKHLANFDVEELQQELSDRVFGENLEPREVEMVEPKVSTQQQVAILPDNGRMLVIVDITELKKAQTEANEQREILEDVFENVAQGLAAYDERANLITWNRKYQDFLILTDEQIYPGCPVWDLVMIHAERGTYNDFERQELEARVQARIDQLMSGEVFRFEYVNANGIEMEAVSSPRPQGGFVVTYADITLQKEAEQKAIQAQREAEQASKVKSEFLANMSHEIRTPLNAIIGMTHLTQQTELSVRQLDYVKKITTASKSLLSIVNDILDFSKIEAGKLILERVDFDLDVVLQNVSNLISGKSQEKSLEFLLMRPSEVPSALVGDPVRLEQILTNLASNAVKFTEQGEVVVGVEHVADLENQVILRFTVRDTGIGMSDEEMSRLFQSFSQADVSTTRRFGGTGLGLAISQRMARMIGAGIAVESKPGVGSTFSFDAAFGMSQFVRTSSIDLDPDLQGMRVLVVDDNPTARAILSGIVESFSFDATTVSSGQEAIELLEKANHGDGKEAFDLVLMDWRMPGMDGIETARTIRSNSKLTQVPTIIMVSAYDRDLAMNQAEGVILDGFVNKPVNTSSLLDAIMTAFGRDTGGKSRAMLLGGDRRAENLNFGGARVLLVEDNPINQQVAVELLRGSGLNVTVASNGRLGIESLEAGEYDLVLMDIQMPEMDGYQATRFIRADGRWDDLPIIAMTAHAMVEEKEKCFAAGMNDHIAKPIDPELLGTTLARWVKVENQPEAHQEDGARDENIPDNLPGLDFAAGLRNLRGNIGLYKRLLNELARDHASAEELIRAEMEPSGDLQTAIRIAHTLKGISGNLGAMDLYEKSSALEEALTTGKAHKAKLNSFAKALGVVVQSVADLGPDHSGTATVVAADDVDMEKLRGIFDSLTERLAERSFQSSALLPELHAALAGHQADLYAELKEQIESFMFEDAEISLANLIALISVDEEGTTSE